MTSSPHFDTLDEGLQVATSGLLRVRMAPRSGPGVVVRDVDDVLEFESIWGATGTVGGTFGGAGLQRRAHAVPLRDSRGAHTRASKTFLRACTR